MKTALAQINPTVGDLAGNTHRLLEACDNALAAGAELVISPELSLTGYPPLDLLYDAAFLREVDVAITSLCDGLPEGIGLLFGAPTANPSAHGGGKPLLNSAFLCEVGRSPQVVHKRLLPSYDVFDECRYFEPAGPQPLMTFRGLKLGVSICEDMWNEPFAASYHTYAAHPMGDLAALGPDLFINISASPYSGHSAGTRTALGRAICERHGIPLILVNQVGANTDLVFDGDSRVHAPDGSVALQAPAFEEALLFWTFTPPSAPDPVGTTTPAPPATPAPNRIHDMRRALVLGIRDYVRKSGAFQGAIVGLSGGIDSAVTAALAAEALGSDRVRGVTMPSRFSSEGSISDSRALASALGIRLDEIPIEPAVTALEGMLNAPFRNTPRGLAEENVQARVRGTVLMALSNKFDLLLLATGNKSELAMGYATLYGDMAGGLAVLADVYKVDVYALAEYMNAEAGRDIIPRATIEKPPSAELRPDQTNQDALPPYDVLDAILSRYIDDRMDAAGIAQATGLDPDLIGDILRAVDRNEYKRKQAAPGLRVSAKAFGPGRRLPITARRTKP